MLLREKGIHDTTGTTGDHAEHDSRWDWMGVIDTRVCLVSERVTMTVKDLLCAPTSWTTGSFARDQKGEPVDLHNPLATSWCLVGAICRVYGTGTEANTAVTRCIDMISPLDAHSDSEYRAALVAWNDAQTRSHQDIVELLEKAGI